MNAVFVEKVTFDALLLILTVAAPVLVSAMGVGLAISVFQATTQINEMTLSFIPKIVAVYVTLVLAMGFIIDKLVTFTGGIFSDFSRFVQ